MTACQFLAAVRRSEKPVEEAIKVMTRFPQTLINVRVKDKHALDGNEAIWDAVRTAEEAMGDYRPRAGSHQRYRTFGARHGGG